METWSQQQVVQKKISYGKATTVGQRGAWFPFRGSMTKACSAEKAVIGKRNNSGPEEVAVFKLNEGG